MKETIKIMTKTRGYCKKYQANLKKNQMKFLDTKNIIIKLDAEWNKH